MTRTSARVYCCTLLLGLSFGSLHCGSDAPDGPQGPAIPPREEIAQQAFGVTPPLALGTIGLAAGSSNLAQTFAVADNTWIGGWRTQLGDVVVKDRIADFDNDGYDDLIIRSAWGMGVLGTDASNNYTSKAVVPWGTNIGLNWTLSPDDRIVAVGKFAPTGGALIVLQNTILGNSNGGVAFVRVASGGFQAASVARLGTYVSGQGMGWLVTGGDRVHYAGKLNGSTDSLVVASAWGMGAWTLDANSNPILIAIADNFNPKTGGGTKWSTTAGSYELRADDPRFRAYGADIDRASGGRHELVLTGPSGVGVFTLNTTGIWGTSVLTLKFVLGDGKLFNMTSSNGTMHSLVKFTDMNHAGGADLLYQTETGISVVGASNTSSLPWAFGPIAQHAYGVGITGGWNFGAGDMLAAYVHDFDVDGQKDFVLTSGWGVGIGTVAGADVTMRAVTPFGSLPISDPDALVGAGIFDRSNRAALLFKNVTPIAPTRPALLTYHNDQFRTGVNPQETSLTPSEVNTFGLAKAYDLRLDAPISGQVLYVPDVSVLGGPPRDVILAATRKNTLYTLTWNSATELVDTLWTKTFPDPESSTRSFALGITGTPVVDYNTKIAYIVYFTGNKADRGVWDTDFDGAYWLVAWDLKQLRRIRWVKIGGSYPKSDGTAEWFDANNHFQRPALLLNKGSVYVGFGAMAGGGREENLKYHGWLFRYEAESLNLQGVFNTSPNEGLPVGGFASGAGIWQAGGGIAADESGNVYFETGNGTDTPSVGTYGDALVKLGPRGNSLQFRGVLRADDANQTLFKRDWDFGGGGPLVIPGTNRIVSGGKEGKYYLTSTLTDGVTQSPIQTNQAYTNLYDFKWRATAGWMGSPHLHGQPVYWNAHIYHQSEFDVLKAYGFDTSNRTLSTAPPVLSSDRRVSPSGEFMRGQLSLSSNGSDPASGVLWVRLQSREDGKTGCEDTPVRTHFDRITAYKATPENGGLTCLSSTVLWTSTLKDDGFKTPSPPTVVAGKVLVVTSDSSGNFVRIFKKGTTSQPGAGCPGSPQHKPPQCAGLPFKGQEARGIDTGDWAPNSFKAECPFDQAGAGLSLTNGTLGANTFYCGRTWSNTLTHTSLSTCRSVNFSTSSVGWSTDWDPGYFKGECAAGEFVAGVAQNPAGALTHILCCKAPIQKTSCAALNIAAAPVDPFDAANHIVGEPGSALLVQVSPPYLPNRWDWGTYMGECGANRYMAGVSRNTATGAGHSIFCCGP
jgi:hypothetical protein